MGKALPYEEFAERFLNRIMVGVALVAVSQLLDLLEGIASGGVQVALELLSKGGGLLAIAIVLPSMLQLIRRRRAMEGCDRDPEGFIAEVYRTAAERAFAVAFIGLTVLGFLLSRGLVELSASTAIKMMSCLTLLSFAAFFFLKSRTGSFED